MNDGYYSCYGTIMCYRNINQSLPLCKFLLMKYYYVPFNLWLFLCIISLLVMFEMNISDVCDKSFFYIKCNQVVSYDMEIDELYNYNKCTIILASVMIKDCNTTMTVKLLLVFTLYALFDVYFSSLELCTPDCNYGVFWLLVFWWASFWRSRLNLKSFHC